MHAFHLVPSITIWRRNRPQRQELAVARAPLPAAAPRGVIIITARGRTLRREAESFGASDRTLRREAVAARQSKLRREAVAVREQAVSARPHAAALNHAHAQRRCGDRREAVNQLPPRATNGCG